MLLQLLLAVGCFNSDKGAAGDTDTPRDTAGDTDVGRDTGADTDTGRDTARDTATADPGAAWYSANCARCHGEDGRLGAEGAEDLTEKVPSLTDEEIAELVRNGKDAMPAFTFSETEMTELLAHLRKTFGGPPAE